MRYLLILFALSVHQLPARAEDGAATASRSVLPKKSSMPWSSVVRAGIGVDNNIDLSRFGSEPTALTGFELDGQLQPRKDFRLALQARYQKNLPFTTSGDGEVGVFAGHLRELPSNMQLRLSAQLALRQERSVFADGAILQNSTDQQSILENSVAALLVSRLGSVDLEVGGQSNVEAHSGNVESSRLLGVHAMAALRYTVRDRIALRARYTYEYSDTRGLSARNLAGGIDSEDRPLLIGVNRLRFSARTRLAQRSSAFLRYDYVSAFDNYSGYLDSHEHVLFGTTTLVLGRLAIEANGELAQRNFFLRTPSIDNPDTDTTFSGSIRMDGWYLPTFAGLRRLGLFALYRAQVVTANPTGLLFARHIGLSGISGQFGQQRY